MSEENASQVDWQNLRRRAIVGISLFLAVVLGIAGFMKLIGLPMMIDKFEQWLYPRWFVHFAGAFELAAAGLIAYPKTRRYGALLAMAAMFGAIITHLKYDYSWTVLILPVLFFAGAWYLNWEMRREAQHSEAAERNGDASEGKNAPSA